MTGRSSRGQAIDKNLWSDGVRCLDDPGARPASSLKTLSIHTNTNNEGCLRMPSLRQVQHCGSYAANPTREEARSPRWL